MPVSSLAPELLAPAGNFDKLLAALRYRADAVYLGGPGLNLRAGSQGFTPEDLGRAVSLAQARGVRVYYCLNALPRERDLPAVRDTLAMLGRHPVDGVIVADPGVVLLARRELPGVPVHISTQANVGNSAAVEFWAEMGARRVNLAREMSLREIRAVAAAVTGVELEVFVHGAMCLAVSGRCFLSAHLNARSANLGRCTQPCRFQYRPVAISLEERLRPEEILWEVVEGEGFTAFFSPRDLCLVKYLVWLRKQRIAALKIEGRMRSSAYVALVCDVYSTALDDLDQGRFRPGAYLRELCGTLHRPMDTGFFLPGAPAKSARRWDCLGLMPMVGRIVEQHSEGSWEVLVLDRWDAAGPVELVLPGLCRPEIRPQEYGLETGKGEKPGLVHPGLRAILRCDHPGLARDTFLRQARTGGEAGGP